MRPSERAAALEREADAVAACGHTLAASALRRMATLLRGDRR